MSSAVVSGVTCISSSSKTSWNTSSNFVYTVKAGDTLFGIASNFGLTVLDIINSNNLDSTNLFIGQELFIPQK